MYDLFNFDFMVRWALKNSEYEEKSRWRRRRTKSFFVNSIELSFLNKICQFYPFFFKFDMAKVHENLFQAKYVVVENTQRKKNPRHFCYRKLQDSLIPEIVVRLFLSWWNNSFFFFFFLLQLIDGYGYDHENCSIYLILPFIFIFIFVHITIETRNWGWKSLHLRNSFHPSILAIQTFSPHNQYPVQPAHCINEIKFQQIW